MLPTDPNRLNVENQLGGPPLVHHAPDRLELGLHMLRSLPDPIMIDAGVLTIGQTADGRWVTYRVAGWNDETQTLILVRLVRDSAVPP